MIDNNNLKQITIEKMNILCKVLKVKENELITLLIDRTYNKMCEPIKQLFPDRDSNDDI
jgi:phage antirepressor YoqD-like protein